MTDEPLQLAALGVQGSRVGRLLQVDALARQLRGPNQVRRGGVELGSIGMGKNRKHVVDQRVGGVLAVEDSNQGPLSKSDPEVYGDDLGGPGDDEGVKAFVLDGHDVGALVSAGGLQKDRSIHQSLKANFIFYLH